MDFAAIRNAAEAYKPAMVKFLRDMIAIPSESCEEEGVVKRIAEELKALGYDKVEFDKLGNVIGWMGEGDKIIAIDSHIDTVGIGNIENWEADPYKGYETDDIIYGRGGSDQEGGMAAAAYGVKIMKDLDLLPKGYKMMVVVVLYFSKLWPFKKPKKGEGFVGLFKMETVMLWLKVVVAILPSAIVGIPFDDWMDAHLHNAPVVAAMLVIYGVAFILVEKNQRARRARIQSVELIDMRMALMIGLFQVLSLVPGTSRSGATILGGILMGCSRAAASEFSFFLAVPTMAGASLLKVLKFGLSFTSEELLILGIGCVSAFVVSIIAIKTFIGYIKQHSFTAFGWYRIILGALVAVYFLLK